MAVFNSVMFNEVSGKMGAMVLGRNGVARRNVTPRNPRTAAQQAVREGFSAASDAWKALSMAQRLGWAMLARQVFLTDAVGRVYSPTGRRLFIACRQRSRTVGQPPPTDAPWALPNAPGVASFAADVSPAGIGHENGLITLTGDCAESGCALVIWATPPYSPDRTRIAAKEFRVLATQSSAADWPAPDALAALFIARWGALEAGARISFEAFQVDANGFAGAVSRADATVGASAAARREAEMEMRRAA